MYTSQKTTKKASGEEYDTSSSSDSDSEPEEEIVQREFTLEELSKYDGINNPEKKIYVSVCGKIFDVTGAGFYGPNETYDMFAGHESSVALAKNELKPSLLDDMDLSKLNTFERDQLNSMFSHFEFKYRVVGWLKEFEEANKKDK
nr:unnamed protein product [Naegleria fowleri]